MTRWALLLLAMLLAPAALADLQNSGQGGNAARSPQLHCEMLQTQARTRADPLRCEISGDVQRVTLLRVRMVGTGHVHAYIIDEVRGMQLAQLDCSSTTTTTCGRVIAPTSTRVGLHAFSDGPGGLLVTATVENAPNDLP